MNSKSALAELEATQALIGPFREKGDFTAEELETLEGLVAKEAEQRKNFERLRAVEESMAEQHRKSIELRQPAEEPPGYPGANLDAERMALALAGQDPRRNWGKAFTDSPAYKALQRDPRSNFEIDLEGKALLVSSETIIPAYRPGIVELSYPPLIVSNLFAVVPVASGIVNYIQEVSFTNAADWVAEGALKPESTKDFSPVQVPIQKIAHFLKVTNEALDDTPQLRALIDNNLRGGIMRKVENALLNASGTPPAIKGLLNFALPAVTAAADIYGSLLKGISAVETAGFTPNGILMNPTDWAQLRTTVGGTPASYLWGAPTEAGVRQVEGLRVVVTSAMPVDTAVVGDFTQAVILQRQAITLRSGLEGRDFVMNIVTILGEARLALAVTNLTAFAKVALPVG